jgi:hypothetical protein
MAAVMANNTQNVRLVNSFFICQNSEGAENHLRPYVTVKF